VSSGHTHLAKLRGSLLEEDETKGLSQLSITKCSRTRRDRQTAHQGHQVLPKTRAAPVNQQDRRFLSGTLPMACLMRRPLVSQDSLAGLW
jgi:hypothetical protein